MKNISDLEISDLEMELEREMDDFSGSAQQGEFEEDLEFESSIEEPEESEFESEPDSEFEFELDGDSAYEADFESSFEAALTQAPPDDYAQRFYELSTREFEDESDLDREIGGILTEMEREYFFGGFKKLLKKGLKYGAKTLMNKAMQHAPGLAAFKGVTGMVRDIAKGNLKSLAKKAIGTALSMHPATSAGLTALKGLGFDPLAEAETNRQAWNNYTAVVRETYDHLAKNLNEHSDQPLEASRQAATAFQSALQSVQSKTASASPRSRKVHRIRVRPGQKIRLIIEGM